MKVTEQYYYCAVQGGSEILRRDLSKKNLLTSTILWGFKLSCTKWFLLDSNVGEMLRQAVFCLNEIY